MKTHTNDYKTEIKKFGRQLDSIITYTLNNEEIELGKEELNSITPHYEGAILKSVMKQLDIDSNVLIDEGTVINYQFGLKVGNSYEYINYGNYVVYKVEKQEDTNSYKLTCYDKMLYAMKDYESLGVPYPITIKNYLTALCSKIGLTLKSSDFANQDRTIASELYLDSDENSLDYTYRDVLDEIAQATGSTICINEDSDELEVRYVSNTGTMSTVEGTSISIPNSDDEKFDLQLQGNTTQEETPTPSSPVPINVVSGRQDIKVEGKQLLPYPYNETTKTTGGITYTDNGDGSITISNTATANAYFNIFPNTAGIRPKYKAGTYTFSNNALLPSGITITFSARNSDGTAISGVSAVYLNNTVKEATRTINQEWELMCNILVSNGTNLSTPITVYPMIEKGSTASSWEAYKGQTYEINLGKNLFDKSTITGITNGTIANDIITSNPISTNYGGVSSTISPLTLQAGTYYISAKVRRVSGTSGSNLTRITLIGVDTTDMTMTLNPNLTNEYQTYCNKIVISSPKTITNIGIQLKPTNADAVMEYTDIMISKTENDTYAPYKTPIELCKIGNYQDRIYKDEGTWYIEKKTNKIASYNGETITTDYISTTGELTTGATIYYVLATPTTTEITDTELISQLNAPELLEGLNNISVSSGDLSSPIKMTYLSELDTIDEEYLKNVNVNFGDKFGKVNSIVLSRSAESDNVYIQDEESIEKNGLCEIKIKDNQILNGLNRDEYLQELLNKLDGLEYYINDFSSPGVLYYDLCDRYKIKIGNNYYKCIMFNDEVNVTQGLEENVYTEMPEESETDYTKADKTDRKINQAYIIVDKQNGEINSVVQAINTLADTVDSQGNEIDALGTRLTQDIDSITASVSAVQSELENGVSLVKTTSVTIDNNGLNVSTDTSKISTTMTNNSFEIKDSGDTTLAYFGYDENEQTSKAEMDNLTVKTYFITGVHRFEKYEENAEQRTGMFYIGG